jgi:transposase
MGRRPRRNHAAAFNAKAALAAVKGDRTLAELVQQFDVNPTQIAEWKNQLHEHTSAVFGEPAKDDPNKVLDVKAPLQSRFRFAFHSR